MLGFFSTSPGTPPMSKPAKESPSREAPAPPEPARRVAPRRATADRRLRILERLTTGLGVAHIAREEGLSVQRIRRIIAEMLESREIDPPAGFVQLQIARLSEAMIVARTMMMEGDLHAMDRLIKLTGELDRYHGFVNPSLSLPAEGSPPRRLAGPDANCRRWICAAGSDEETFPGCKLLKSHETGLESADWSSPPRSSRGGVGGGALRAACGSLQEQLWPRPAPPLTPHRR